jgi:hypothetical protein
VIHKHRLYGSWAAKKQLATGLGVKVEAKHAEPRSMALGSSFNLAQKPGACSVANQQKARDVSRRGVLAAAFELSKPFLLVFKAC